MKLYKIMENLNPSKANGVSFSALLLSVFIYISIFYIFDISPSTLLSNTRFWFFISNTLILIIAADYGSFSSSKQKQDINYYNEERMPHSQESRNNNNYYYCYNISPPPPPIVSRRIPEMVDKSIVVYGSTYQQKDGDNLILKSNEKNLQNVAPDREVCREISPKPIEKEFEGNEKSSLESRLCGRSKSDREMKVQVDDNKNMLHRSESEKHEKIVQDDEEDNELLNISDDELNRRVEEFIRKFNTHLRLQAEATKSGHM